MEAKFEKMQFLIKNIRFLFFSCEILQSLAIETLDLDPH